MKKLFVSIPALIAVLGLAFSSCENPSGGGGGDYVAPLTDLQKYENAGKNVAARPWSEDYDCSNFSTQFYKNCYEAEIPVRVRLGISGGANFTAENHAWNSVKINGKWVDWEPQLNAVYSGHKKTASQIKIEGKPTLFTDEQVARIMYETIGRYVPSSVIDSHEIDDYLLFGSPFNAYFVSLAVCVSDEPAPDAATQALLNQLAEDLPYDGEGDMYISTDLLHLAWAFNLGGKYYIIANIEQTDPAEGRQVLRPKSVPSDLTKIEGWHVAY
jgi:hypothetical protein